jgi:hypothetical protein
MSMADQRKGDGRQRTRREAGLIDDRRASGVEEALKSTSNERHATEESIKAVSDALSAKKASFARTSALGPSSPTKASEPLAEIARRLKSLPGRQAKAGSSPVSLVLPAVKPPDAISVEGASIVGFPSGEPTRLGSSRGADPVSSPGVDEGPRSVGADVPSVVPVASKPIEPIGTSSGTDRSKTEAMAPDHRIAVSDSQIQAGGVPLEAPASRDDHPLAETDPAIGFTPRRGASAFHGIGPTFERPGPLADPQDEVIDRGRGSAGATTNSVWRHPVEVQGIGGGLPDSGLSVEKPGNPAIPAEPFMTSVRNPLSSELRNISMTSPTMAAGIGASSGPDRIESSPGRDAFGAAASSQAGASVDLSRTNELLQQLVEAVRKQRGSSLPTGGPSVYPDR